MKRYLLVVLAAVLVLSAYADHMGYSSLPGSLVAWGKNDYGQTNCPAETTYVAIAAGTFHSLALRSDGTLVGRASTPGQPGA